MGGEEVDGVSGVLAELAIDADEFCSISDEFCAIGRGEGLFFKLLVEALPFSEKTVAFFDVTVAETVEDGEFAESGVLVAFESSEDFGVEALDDESGKVD